MEMALDLLPQVLSHMQPRWRYLYVFYIGEFRRGFKTNVSLQIPRMSDSESVQNRERFRYWEKSRNVQSTIVDLLTLLLQYVISFKTKNFRDRYLLEGRTFYTPFPE